MTPPATAAARVLPRRPPGPRRVSGPRGVPAPARAGAPAYAPSPAGVPSRGGARVTLPAFGRWIAHRAAALPDARFLDRLIRGRGWIAIVAAALMGIVFMQVSLLKLNTGIGRAVQAASTLERQNSELRTQVSRLGSGERVQGVASRQGMVLPAAGDVHYLRATRADGARAARSIAEPDPVAQQPAGTTTATSGTPGAAATPATPGAPAMTTAPAANAAAAAQGATGQGATTPGTTTPGATTPGTAAAPTAGASAPPAGTAPPTPPSGTPTGGAAQAAPPTTAPPPASTPGG